MQELKRAKELTELDTRNFSRGVDDLPVTLIHVEVDYKNQPLLYQETFWSWADLNQRTAPNFDSTRIAPHHSDEVSTNLSQPISGLLNNLFGGAPRNPLLQAVRGSKTGLSALIN